MPRDEHQLGLFGPPDPPVRRPTPATHPESVLDVATRLPRGIHLGTSSWAFPGWAGLIYDGRHTERSLAREGLAAYASCPLHRTVGLDRAFYKPLPEDEYRGLASQVPAGFRFLVKAWQGVTRPDTDERGRTQGPVAPKRLLGRANAGFLDPSLAIDLVLAPALRGLGASLGPVVFQFPPLDLTRSGAFGSAPALLGRLTAFATALRERIGSRVLVAYEMRNRELFEPNNARRLAAGLEDAGAALCLAHHPSVPRIRAQREALRAGGYPLEAQPAMVCRWLLRHDQTYTGARDRYLPFNALIDADVETRDEIAGAARAFLAHSPMADRTAWVIANNKAEGSAPITLRRLASHVAGPDA